MLCLSCSSEFPEGKRYCGDCGAPVVPVCRQCGATLVSGKRYCGDCGSATGDGEATNPAPTVRDEPVAERRRCSVLFVDLVDYTSFAEHRDPEEVRELLSSYFDAAQSIIQRYGGTLEKFIGDAVMAVWGAPIANEDDAERAVRAGLEVLQAVRVVGTSAGVVLRARGGIVTGEAAVTIGKVAEGMVLGDAVNAAARLQGVADPDTMLVDRATWSAASDAVAFEAIGELRVKGRAEAIEAWRALRVVSQRRGLGRAERLEPPFVGRDDEMRLIRELLHSTAREGRARLVSVTGVPGIGKSRLIWELLKYVDGLSEDVYWHQGQSAAYGESASFGALAEMVRSRAEILETDETDVAREKLRASVRAFVPDDAEREWIMPRLTSLLGLSEATGADSGELFSAWRAFFEHVSNVGVTVMVFEDLQWADPGLVDFIESMLEWSRDFPIMIVTLSRPEFFDQRSAWGAGQPRFVSVHLQALDDATMTELVEGFVTGVPATLLARILERAEGVPLYAVETVRMLVDRGVLVEHEGAYRLEGEVDDLEIPGTLQTLVASRLDALKKEHRALLQDASVIGAHFLPATLAAVSGVDRSQIEVELRELVHREFLHFENDSRSPERGQYGFVQSVIGEVARSMMSRRDLSTKHLTLARHYESIGDDELIETVASHYAAAYRSAPDAENAALAAPAQVWLHRAGERAKSLGSLAQVLTLLDEALAIEVPGADRRPMLHLAFDAAFAQSRIDRAIELLRDLMKEDEQVDDVLARAATAAKHSAVLRETNESTEAARVAIEGFDQLGDVDAPSERADLATAAARSLSLASRPDEALTWSNRALTFAESVENPWQFALALRVRAIVLARLNRNREALLLSRGSVEFAEKADSTLAQLLAKDVVASLVGLDDPYGSYVIQREIVELARRTGQRRNEDLAILNAFELAIHLGRWPEAVALNEELRPRELGRLGIHRQLVEARLIALQEGVGVDTALLAEDLIWTEDLDETSMVECLNMQSAIYYGQGDYERARSAVTRARMTDAEGNSPFSFLAWFRSEVQLRNVDGIARAQAAVDMLWGRWMSAMRQEMAAAAAALEGRVDASRGLFGAAIESYRELHCTLDLAVCEYEEVFLLGVERADPKHVTEAESIFRSLDARALLDRLDRAVHESANAN